MATMIKQCNCKHEFQDSMYGTNKRVYNYRNKPETWKCTVCGKETFKEQKK